MCPKACHVTAHATKGDRHARGPSSVCDGSDGFVRVFSDEFDGPTLNVSNWEVVTGNTGHSSITRSAWGHADNVYLEKGALVLRTRRPSRGERSNASTAAVPVFTGAVTSFKRRHFRPGRLCVSARLPGTSEGAGQAAGANQGLWPAHWLMPIHANDFDQTQGCWPDLGEVLARLSHDSRTPLDTHTAHAHRTPHRLSFGAFVCALCAQSRIYPYPHVGACVLYAACTCAASPQIDIMEAVNGEPAYYGTYHWNSRASRCSVVDGSGRGGHAAAQKCTPLWRWDEVFHEYAVEWDGASYLSFYVNGVLVGTLSASETGLLTNHDAGVDVASARPLFYDDPLFLMLQTAVGGDWPGEPTEATVLPAYHLIDYVRYEERVGS